MIKVKDLSLGFQNVYFNYKKSFIKKRDNIGNQYEEMNKYLLDKQKEPCFRCSCFWMVNILRSC